MVNERPSNYIQYKQLQKIQLGSALTVSNAPNLIQYINK